MFNSKALSQLSRVSITSEEATMSDGKYTYTFLINPSTISWGATGEYSLIPVLDTQQPQVKFKYGNRSLSMPVLFWTPGDSLDISPLLDKLTVWTQAGAEVNFKWGSINTLCFINKFSHTISQMRAGKPTKAEGNLELLLKPEAPKAQPPDKIRVIKATKREASKVK